MARAPCISCWVAILTLGLAAAQTNTGTNQQGTGMTPCQQTFLTNFYKCIGDNGLDTNNFLYMVTNKTNGQAAADEEAFKTSACGKKDEIAQCMITFMTELMNSTTCQATASSQDQRPMIDRQFVSLMRSFDMSCAHPCRQTFFPALKDCYESNNLDPDLFLSNATMGRGAVIGTTDEEANAYCENRDSLFQCMRKISAECPESPMLLGSIGMDIDAMEKGIGVLCQHVEVYLFGIECFAEATEEVEKCMMDQAKNITDLVGQAQESNMEEEMFAEKYCGIRIAHVGCDLNAWRGKKHKACSTAVIGLRTELECTLLSDDCVAGHKSTVDVTCHVEKFKREDRKEGGASVLATSSVFSLVLISVVSMVTGRA